MYTVIICSIRRPDCFIDEDGHEVALTTWAQLVISGQWKAQGTRPVRLREV
jgi:hypothetical protein